MRIGKTVKILAVVLAAILVLALIPAAGAECGHE